MPLFCQTHQFLTLLVCFKIKVLVLVDEAVGGQGKVGLYARLRCRLSGGFRVVIQVGHGGDAEAQALGDGHFRRRLGSSGVHPSLHLQLIIQGLPPGQVV